MADQPTVAEAIAEVLAGYGVKRIFGIPGGGSSLDVIAACAGRGIDYVLTHTETAAAIMASVTGEITGAPGVVSVGLGPGAAAVANGVAYASLDRAPLLVLTDSYQPGGHDFITHQKYDHQALFAPITKGSVRARPDDVADVLDGLLRTALATPQGPVHMDLSAADAGQPTAPPTPRAAAEGAIAGDVARARELLDGARRPVVVAGLQARGEAAASAVRELAERLSCPAMTTYKAKGVVPDDHPHYAGILTGGRTEAPWLADCDLLVLCGLDPVELIASPWPYDMPVLEIAEAEIRPHYAEPAASLFGPLPAALDALDGAGLPANWGEEPAPLVLPESAGNGLSPIGVVRAVRAAAPDETRAAADAGAHILPVMATWSTRHPHDLLISNGLSTMGFALPAAIASALAEPDRPAVALTGDGGLAMCLAELATAARNRLPVVVVVLNDAALSMIDLKQQQRGHESRGVRYPALDFAAIAEGAGCRAWRAADKATLDEALAQAFACGGPALIDVAVDPTEYRAQFEAIRGAPGAAART